MRKRAPNMQWVLLKNLSMSGGNIDWDGQYASNKVKKRKQLLSEQSDFILLNLYIALKNLLADLWEPKYKKYKYISSLPTSSYKTVQMILGRMGDSCGKAYMEQLSKISY